MKFKKIISMSTVLVLTASMAIGCSNKSKDEKSSSKGMKITLVTDVGGINDQSFNQSAWEGLKKAEKELGVSIKALESKQDADYAPNLETAIDNGSDLIIGVGYKMADAMKKAAKDYPDQKFAIVDNDYGKDQPKNINSIMFNAQEASYLVGVVAGKMTTTNKVGFIGGMQSPTIETFQYGYMAGVKNAKKDAEVVSQYANSFSDSAKGKSIANQMYGSNADIIFVAAGDTGTGVIEAAKEGDKKVIGVDRDQNSLAPKNVITSAMKRVDVGTYNVVKAVKDNKFEGGKATVYGLKEGGVGIAPSTDKNVPKDVIDYVTKVQDKIKNGEIKVPSTKEEYDKIK